CRPAATPFPVPSGWSGRHEQSRRYQFESFFLSRSEIQRQKQGKDGTTRHAFAFDQAMVPGDDVLGDRQAQAGAVGATADQGIEDAVEDARGNAGAVIEDLQPAYQAMATLVDGELAQRAGAQGDLPMLAARPGQQRLHG